MLNELHEQNNLRFATADFGSVRSSRDVCRNHVCAPKGRKDEIQSRHRNEKRPFILCPFVAVINGILCRYLTYTSHVIKVGKTQLPSGYFRARCAEDAARSINHG